MNWRFKVLKRIWTPRGGSASAPGIIHVYNVQRYSPLKPIKVKFYRKHLYEGGTNVIISKPGHMTKMACNAHIW